MRGKGWPQDREPYLDAFRLGISEYMGIRQQPSDCAPSRQAGPAPHSQARAACRNLSWVGEGVQRAACLMIRQYNKAFLAQIGIFVAGKYRLAAFPDRLMHMHSRAIVANTGFGMKVAVLRSFAPPGGCNIYRPEGDRPSSSVARTSCRAHAARNRLRDGAFRPLAPICAMAEHFATHVLRRILRGTGK